MSALDVDGDGRLFELCALLLGVGVTAAEVALLLLKGISPNFHDEVGHRGGVAANLPQLLLHLQSACYII